MKPQDSSYAMPVRRIILSTLAFIVGVFILAWLISLFGPVASFSDVRPVVITVAIAICAIGIYLLLRLGRGTKNRKMWAALGTFVLIEIAITIWIVGFMV